MKYKYYDKFINKKTNIRYDVTPLFSNPTVFNNLVNDLISPFKKVKFNKIAGLDALGFVISGAMALRLKKPLILVRKGGKLPGKRGTVIKISFVDYTKKKKSFEMNKGSIKKGDRVLIVDEWIDTGTQAKAAIKLIEKQKGKVIGISCIAARRNPKTELLFKKYNCVAIRK